MTNLEVHAKTNISGSVRIDYITILTKDGQEISLNWNESFYVPSNNKRPSLLKRKRKFSANFKEIFWEDEEFTDFDKLNIIQDAGVTEIQLYVEDLDQEDIEKIEFILDQVEFTFEYEDQNGIVFSYSMPIKCESGYNIAIER